MKLQHLVGVLLILCIAASSGRAQIARSKIVWREDGPYLQVHVAAHVPEEVKELTAPVSLFDDGGALIWSTAAKIVFAEDKPSMASIKLEKIAKPESRHRVRVGLDRRDLGLIYSEAINFAEEKEAVPSYSLRREGEFPDERIYLVLVMNAVNRANIENVDLAVTLRDTDDNVVIDKMFKVPVSIQGTDYKLDITPTRQSVGPYALEYRIENDALGIYFSASDRFAFANVLVPVSSMEIDDRTWFGSEAADPHHYRTGSYYYSNHLTDNSRSPYPPIGYDEEIKRTGRRSLRIDYTQGRAAHVFSRLALPGLPITARIWVKGNNTSDTLIVHWCDKSDDARQAWYRSANFSRAPLCTLDFEGWRSFRAPVLGEGMQVAVNIAGSSPGIDAPISLLAFTIRPGPLPKGAERGESRAIWIDDVYVETQAHTNEQASMELRADTGDRLLHEKARLYVSVGNGSTEHVKDGKLRLVATSRAAEPLLELNETVEVEPAGLVVREFSLAEVHARSPLGPVDVDVTFVAPAVVGLRTTKRITFKSARSFGLFWDFEKGVEYNGFWGGTGAGSAPGGAGNSPKALCMKLTVPKPDPDPRKKETQDMRPQNCVILHPALPGMVDRIEVMVRGSGKPVELQPLLLDGGLSGIWLREYNVFWSPSTIVDWQGWRKVELVAPAVPAHYGSKNKFFLFEPYYPLNLCLKALADEPTEIYFDNIRVKTHLLPEEELLAEIDYPDESCIHAPGAPLELVLMNFSSKDKEVSIGLRLESYQQRTEAEQAAGVTVPAGCRIIHKLVPSLSPGIYAATVRLEDKALKARDEQAEDRIITACIQVLDQTQYFGDVPLELLKQFGELRKAVGMTVEEARLDWDNMEAVPGFFHYDWFHNEVKKKSADGAYEVLPVVGFSADWAGPHARESITKGTYSRFIGNYLQVPVRLADWSAYIRECAREFNGKFKKWVFWENPDLDGPQGLSPTRYEQMLTIFHKWFSLYDPKAGIVAGGFNYDTVLQYLDTVEKPEELAFDEIAVQMNIGELSPEEADVEGVLDELNEMLEIQKRERSIQLTEMDWPIGTYVSPAEHAAYHARSLLLLNSRGASPHRFSLVNSGRTFDSYGIFHSNLYGNSENIGGQHLKPFYVPKPAYFSLTHAQRFLARWVFQRSVLIPDANLQANRAFIYRNAAGELAAVVWRTVGAPKLYKVPSTWKGAKARDAFGFDLSLDDGLRLAALPSFVELPAPYTIDQLAFDLRTLQPADGEDIVLLDLYVGEPDSCERAHYVATGKAEPGTMRGKLPAGRKLKEVFLFGLQAEQFEFHADQPGTVLMSRRWHFGAEGQKLSVQLNDGKEQTWDLSKSKMNVPGIRESTFVLRDCIRGGNAVKIRYEKPGNCSGYRLQPLPSDYVDLARWGVFNAMQTKGELEKYKSASGTPLAIGKTPYETGLGAHAVSLVEYPLDGQFAAFGVTVGIDTVTDGRGSVVFEIHVDGKEQAKSSLMNGFSEPETLKVDGLEKAQRLFLIVKDGEDGNQDDLADWVDGKLFLK